MTGPTYESPGEAQQLCASRHLLGTVLSFPLLSISVPGTAGQSPPDVPFLGARCSLSPRHVQNHSCSQGASIILSSTRNRPKITPQSEDEHRAMTCVWWQGALATSKGWRQFPGAQGGPGTLGLGGNELGPGSWRCNVGR